MFPVHPCQQIYLFICIYSTDVKRGRMTKIEAKILFSRPRPDYHQNVEEAKALKSVVCLVFIDF